MRSRTGVLTVLQVDRGITRCQMRKKKNHAKVKARDIIPGWPRGRSTSSDKSYEEYGEIDLWWLHFGRANWSVDDMLMLVGDKQVNFEYHARQRAMMEEFRSRYRRPRDLRNYKIVGIDYASPKTKRPSKAS